jgi:hypothetical protein
MVRNEVKKIIPKKTPQTIYLTKTGWIKLWILPEEYHLTNEQFNSLYEEHPEEEPTFTLYGKLRTMRRYVKFYSNTIKNYLFSRKIFVAEPYPLQK